LEGLPLLDDVATPTMGPVMRADIRQLAIPKPTPVAVDTSTLKHDPTWLRARCLDIE